MRLVALLVLVSLLPTVFAFGIVYDPKVQKYYSNIVPGICHEEKDYVQCFLDTPAAVTWKNNTYSFSSEYPITKDYRIKVNTKEFCVYYITRQYTYRDVEEWSKRLFVPLDAIYSKDTHTICVRMRDLLKVFQKPFDYVTYVVSTLTLQSPSEYLVLKNVTCTPTIATLYKCTFVLTLKEGYYVDRNVIRVPKEDVYWYPISSRLKDWYREYRVLKEFTVAKLEDALKEPVSVYIVNYTDNKNIKDWLYPGTNLVLLKNHRSFVVRPTKGKGTSTFISQLKLFNVSKIFGPVKEVQEKLQKVKPETILYVIAGVVGVVLGILTGLLKKILPFFSFLIFFLLVPSVYSITCVYDPNKTVQYFFLNNPSLPKKCKLVPVQNVTGIINDTVYTFRYLAQGTSTIYVDPVPEPHVPSLTLEVFPWIPSVCTERIPQKWVFMLGRFLVLKPSSNTLFVYCDKPIIGKIVVHPAMYISKNDTVSIYYNSTHVIVKGDLPEQEIIVEYEEPKCTKYFIERFLYMGESLGMALYLTYLRFGCVPKYVKGNLYSSVKYTLNFIPKIPFVLPNGLIAYSENGTYFLENVYIVDGTWKFLTESTKDILPDLLSYKRYIIFDAPSSTKTYTKVPFSYYLDPYSFVLKPLTSYFLHTHYMYGDYISFQPVNVTITKKKEKFFLAHAIPTCTLYKDYAICTYVTRDTYTFVDCIGKIYPPHTVVVEKVPIDNLYEDFLINNVLIRLYKCSFEYNGKVYHAGEFEEKPVNVTIKVLRVEVPDKDMMPVNQPVPIIVTLYVNSTIPLENVTLLTPYGKLRVHTGYGTYIIRTIGVECHKRKGLTWCVNRLGVPVTFTIDGKEYTLQPYQSLYIIEEVKYVYEWYDPRTTTGKLLMILVGVLSFVLGFIIARVIVKE